MKTLKIGDVAIMNPTKNVEPHLYYEIGVVTEISIISLGTFVYLETIYGRKSFMTPSSLTKIGKL